MNRKWNVVNERFYDCCHSGRMHCLAILLWFELTTESPLSCQSAESGKRVFFLLRKNNDIQITKRLQFFSSVSIKWYVVGFIFD